MYPSSLPDAPFNRTKTDDQLAAFFAGTQARSFRELSLTAGATLYVRMVRPIDVILRKFGLFVNAGEIRCEIYRGATPSGTWSESLPVIPKNETAGRPTPAYVPQSHLEAGGAFTGGTLYDVIHVKTAGATGQQSTVGGNRDDILGAPAGTGWYKFTNPGTGAATGIFTISWDELPAT